MKMKISAEEKVIKVVFDSFVRKIIGDAKFTKVLRKIK